MGRAAHGGRGHFAYDVVNKGPFPGEAHACCALPAIPWAECYTSTPPGVPLEEDVTIPGTPVAKNGRLTPSDGPGFGVTLDPARFTSMAG